MLQWLDNLILPKTAGLQGAADSFRRAAIVLAVGGAILVTCGVIIIVAYATGT